jgi:hypothetical protein
MQWMFNEYGQVKLWVLFFVIAPFILVTGVGGGLLLHSFGIQ